MGVRFRAFSAPPQSVSVIHAGETPPPPLAKPLLQRIFPDVALTISLDRAVVAIDLDADDDFASACAAAGVPLVAGVTEREALLEARSILTDYPLAAAMTERAPLAAAAGM